MIFFLVDDDPVVTRIASEALGRAGHVVKLFTSSLAALREIEAHPPDGVLVDIMLPDMDGLELCRRVRQLPNLNGTRLIVVSSKAYDTDRQRAIASGADAFMVKPIGASFLEDINRICSDTIKLSYWGTRGTLPVSGPQTLRYGGDTSCMTLSFRNDRLWIFDAGTGIRKLSGEVMSRKVRVTAKIFLTHPHWDHINALPFFAPLYVPGNDFEICGPAQGKLSVHDLVSAQMDGVFFPITVREFAAHVRYRDLREERLEMEGISLQTMLLNHPGYCLGYRVNYNGRSICYVTDNELYPPNLPQRDAHYIDRLTEFVRGADVLITDTAYTDEGYKSKVGWGHSSVTQVVDLAVRAEVKELHLFHHDPEQSDDAIDQKLDTAQRVLRDCGATTKCLAPAAGESFLL